MYVRISKNLPGLLEARFFKDGVLGFDVQVLFGVGNSHGSGSCRVTELVVTSGYPDLPPSIRFDEFDD
jgi:hypothetical protein